MTSTEVLGFISLAEQSDPDWVGPRCITMSVEDADELNKEFSAVETTVPGIFGKLYDVAIYADGGA